VKRLLLDLNVFLDVILDRRPEADVAAALWAAIERGEGEGMVPAHGVTTIFYLLEKARGAAFAREGVERLIGVFAVAPVDDAVVRRALALAWPDFEDAVCAASAEASGCDALSPAIRTDIPGRRSRCSTRRRRWCGWRRPSGAVRGRPLYVSPCEYVRHLTREVGTPMMFPTFNGRSWRCECSPPPRLRSAPFSRRIPVA
jgi:predicted nucleic acid-binding protein